MGLLDNWNKNKFSIYKSEEKTVLKLIESIGKWLEKIIIGIDGKTDLYGDHKGTWQGLNKPTLSEEGMRATVEKILTEDIPKIDNVVAITEPIEKQINIINKYKYLMTTFQADSVSDDNSKLVILLSNDGITWDNLNINYQSRKLRDPQVFKKGEYYYITATNLLRNDSIIYIRTKNFVNFDEIVMPYTGLAQYKAIWAPSVFKSGKNYYMTVSLSLDDSSIYYMNQYVTLLDENLMPTTWEKIIFNDLNNECTSVYDGHIIAGKNKFYFYYKNTTVGHEGIEIAESDSVFGKYDRLGCIESDNNLEGGFIIKVGDALRMYTDTYLDKGRLRYKDMKNDLGVNKDLIFTDNKIYKHCHIIDLTGENWESNFVFDKSFIELSDLNDLTIPYYNKRSFTPRTLNTPDIDSNEKWGKVTLYLAGGGNYIQELTLLSKRKFIRNYVDGNWSDYSEVLTATAEITDINLNSEYLDGSDYELFYLKYGNFVVVNYKFKFSKNLVDLAIIARGLPRPKMGTLFSPFDGMCLKMNDDGNIIEFYGKKDVTGITVKGSFTYISK